MTTNFSSSAALYSTDCYIPCLETLSVSTYTLDNVTLYPNPVKSILNIKTNDNSPIEKVKLYNITGQLVMESISSTLNLQALDSGVYFVKVKTDKGIVTKKILKE